MNRQIVNRVVAAVVGLSAFWSVSHAQTWPTRPVTMVAPYAAGSASDNVARALAPRLAELLGQPVIIENVTGAGGMIASARVAKAAPDFHQFVLGGSGTHAQSQAVYKKPLYNPVTDFTPVALIGTGASVLITRNEFPANTLPEFLTYAKANQAKMQYGSAGTGSGIHLSCLLFNAAAGLNITHVPYRGSPAALQDLIPGRIDYMCPVDGSVVAQIEGKTVKPIAVLATERSPVLPTIATASEQGLKDFEAGIWWAFFLPKGTPSDIADRFNQATRAMIDTPAVQKRMGEIGVKLVSEERRSPSYLQKFVASEIEKWSGPIKASGLLLD